VHSDHAAIQHGGGRSRRTYISGPQGGERDGCRLQVIAQLVGEKIPVVRATP
jgi:hypothetical protein